MSPDATLFANRIFNLQLVHISAEKALLAFSAKTFADGDIFNVSAEKKKCEEAARGSDVKVYDSLFVRHWDEFKSTNGEINQLHYIHFSLNSTSKADAKGDGTWEVDLDESKPGQIKVTSPLAGTTMVRSLSWHWHGHVEAHENRIMLRNVRLVHLGRLTTILFRQLICFSKQKTQIFPSLGTLECKYSSYRLRHLMLPRFNLQWGIKDRLHRRNYHLMDPGLCGCSNKSMDMKPTEIDWSFMKSMKKSLGRRDGERRRDGIDHRSRFHGKTIVKELG